MISIIPCLKISSYTSISRKKIRAHHNPSLLNNYLTSLSRHMPTSAQITVFNSTSTYSLILLVCQVEANLTFQNNSLDQTKNLDWQIPACTIGHGHLGLAVHPVWESHTLPTADLDWSPFILLFQFLKATHLRKHSSNRSASLQHIFFKYLVM